MLAHVVRQVDHVPIAAQHHDEAIQRLQVAGGHRLLPGLSPRPWGEDRGQWGLDPPPPQQGPSAPRTARGSAPSCPPPGPATLQPQHWGVLEGVSPWASRRRRRRKLSVRRMTEALSRWAPRPRGRGRACASCTNTSVSRLRRLRAASRDRSLRSSVVDLPQPGAGGQGRGRLGSAPASACSRPSSPRPGRLGPLPASAQTPRSHGRSGLDAWVPALARGGEWGVRG